MCVLGFFLDMHLYRSVFDPVWLWMEIWVDVADASLSTGCNPFVNSCSGTCSLCCPRDLVYEYNFPIDKKKSSNKNCCII